MPLSTFTLEDAEGAMRRIDELRQAREDDRAAAACRTARKLRPVGRTSRRQYAQVIHRVLALAVYPAKLLKANPLPKGFLPKPSGEKAHAYLYPTEDRLLMRLETVPLVRRLIYGFLAREGMREGEALALRWRDLDLSRGAVTLDENTDDPRSWAFSPGVREALAAWKKRRGQVQDDDLVFAEVELVDDEPVLRPLSKWGLADHLRVDLKAAGVTRSELFERSASRKPIRVHDLRATFVTISLANGKSESWVADRTGHRSSQMINRYRRAARKVEELKLGELAPLDVAIPDLGAAQRVDMTPPREVLTIEQRLARIRTMAQIVTGASVGRILGRGSLGRPKRKGKALSFPVGRQGIEPWTYGLKGRSEHEEVRGVGGDLIPSGSFVARRVLELAAASDPGVVEAARALAAIVLAGDDVRLARKIEEGGRLAIAHAVELAERLLAASSASASPERTRAS